jgi:predicted nucleotidyltransferase
MRMKQTAEIVDILRAYKPGAIGRYGITRLGLFGSVARGQHHAGSDIDVCFEGGHPTLLTIARMEIELEGLTGSKVHVTVYHDDLPERMKERINEDVIWI